MLKGREWVKKLYENMGILFKKINFRDLLIRFFCTSLAIVSILIFIIPFQISKRNNLTPTHEETEIAELIPIPDVDVSIETTTIVESTTGAQETQTIQQENITETTTKYNPPITETTNTITKPVINTNGTFQLTNEERRIVECIVMGESGGEIYKGQVLVAQCILNACLKEKRQPSDIRRIYQYAGWHSNPSESVKKAVSAVFDQGYKVTTEPILYFYAPNLCNGAWHETQRFVIEVGAHRFFAQW
jgi:hypothetical protein